MNDLLGHQAFLLLPNQERLIRQMCALCGVRACRVSRMGMLFVVHVLYGLRVCVPWCVYHTKPHVCVRGILNSVRVW